MSVFVLSIGLVVRRGARTWRLERRLEDDTLVFVDQIDGKPMTLTVSQLWKELLSKKLTIAQGDGPIGTEGSDPQFVMDWASLRDELRVDAERKLHYVREIRRAGLSRGMRRRIEQEILKIAKRLADSKPPSASAVMRDMRNLDNGGGAPIAVIAKRLHRMRKSNKPQVKEIARSVLKDVYCTRQRLSLKATHVHLHKELAAKVLQGAVSAEDASISISTLRRLKDEIDPYALSLARYGAAFARNEWRYALTGNTTVRAMQRYEVDHTVMDFVVICDKTGLPLGRPTITIVVDAFSGYVVGFFVSFWGTGLATTFSALKVALSPKQAFTDGHDLSNPWLGMGIPELLVVDNGLEFHSPQFKGAALQLSIDLLYCAVRQPWLKPVVERALGTYNNYLPALGRVRKRLNNEIPLCPKETSVISFSSLCRGLLKAFVDVHPFEVNQRKLARPYDLFRDSLSELPPPSLPTSLDELDVAAAISKSLTISHEGAVPFSLRYNSRELQDLRRSIDSRFKTNVKFNPEDLGHIYVQDPRHGRWLMVPSCMPQYTTGLSLVQHKAIRAQAQSRLKSLGAEEALLRAKRELIDIWDGAALLGKKIKNLNVKALSGLTSGASLRPQAEAVQPPKPERFISAEDLVTSPKEVPLFEAFEL